MTRQRGSALTEFAVAWPVLLLAALGSVELSIWSAEAAAARSAALAGARAGAVPGAGAPVAQAVAQAALGRALVGAGPAGWCPGAGGRPPAVWVCASDLGDAIEVAVGGAAPALVPLVAGAGLPLRAAAHVPKEAFR